MTGARLLEKRLPSWRWFRAMSAGTGLRRGTWPESSIPTATDISHIWRFFVHASFSRRSSAWAVLKASDAWVSIIFRPQSDFSISSIGIHCSIAEPICAQTTRPTGTSSSRSSSRPK